MALDPNDPMQAALYPPTDLVWPPPEYAGLFSFDAQQPTPEQMALAEYGLPSVGGIPGQPIPPPPPPPPPVKQLGGPGLVPDELAAPIPAAAPAQPAPMAPQVSDLVSVQPELTGANDPWEVFNAQGAAPPDANQQLSSALEQHAGEPFTPEATLTPEQRLFSTLDTLDDPRLTAYAKQDPEGYGAYAVHKDEQKRIDIAQQGADIAERDAKAQAENVRIRNEAQRAAKAAEVQLQHESDTMAADGGFWDSRTDGQKLLGLLSIGVGAFVAGPNGENKALAIWEKSIDRHVANAKRKLADKQSAVSRLYARVGDDFLADETMRQATLKAAYGDLASKEQLYAVEGTTRMKMVQKRLEISASLAESRQRAAQYVEKRNVDQAKAAADIRKTIAEAVGLERKNAGIGVGGGVGGAKSEKQVFTSDTLPLPPGAWVPPKGWTGTLRDYSALADAANKGQSVAGGGAVGAEQRHSAQERAIPGVFELDDKGTKVPFEAKGTTVEVAALRNKLIGTREVISLLDEASSIRSGWSSNSGNSDENQKLKVIMGKIEFAVKNAENLGQITENDREMVGSLVGTADFTRYKDFDAAVTQARKNLIGSARNNLVGLGLSPKAASKYDIPNLYGAKHVTTEGEKDYKAHIDRDQQDTLDSKGRRLPGPAGVQMPRDPVTGNGQFTGDIGTPAPMVATPETERVRQLRNVRLQRLHELEKADPKAVLLLNNKNQIINADTGAVIE